jgi:hypothetical protein
MLAKGDEVGGVVGRVPKLLINDHYACVDNLLLSTHHSPHAFPAGFP